MERLLLLVTTTTYKAQSFLEAAAKLGAAVTVGTDGRQTLAALHPEGFLRLDFDDPQAAAGDIAAFAARWPVDAVVAADDDGVVLAALAAQALGLPHNPPEAVRAARNKRRTREALCAAGLLAPWFRLVHADADPTIAARTVDYPCVLKPLALAASRGVIRADDPASFVAAFHRIAAILRSRDAARTAGELGPDAVEEILVEGFLPGAEFAVEGVLEDGRLHVLALFDKPDPLDGPFFEETIYVTPSRQPQEVQAGLADMAQRASAALGLRHGPLHAELRWNERGAWLLEAAPRSIGGLCSRALRFGDGSVSLEELLLRHALGQRDTAVLAREKAASGVLMVPIPRAGVLRAVGGVEAAASVPGIDEVRLAVPIGSVVVPPPEGARYLGFVFARGASPAAVESALRASHARLEIEIDPLAADEMPGAVAAATARSASPTP